MEPSTECVQVKRVRVLHGNNCCYERAVAQWPIPMHNLKTGICNGPESQKKREKRRVWKNIWKRDLREGGRGPRWPAHPSKPYMGTGRLAACSSLVGEAIEAGDSSDVGAEHSLLLRLLDPPTYTQPTTPCQQSELNPASASLLLEIVLSSSARALDFSFLSRQF